MFSMKNEVAWFNSRVRIEGRVVRKSHIRNYNNGLGQFFTFDFADLSGVIRCKAFNNAASRFMNIIHESKVTFFLQIFFSIYFLFKVYSLNNFLLNRANKQYNHLEHDFEINLIEESGITQVESNQYEDVDLAFKTTKMSSVSIADIGKCFGS